MMGIAVRLLILIACFASVGLLTTAFMGTALNRRTKQRAINKRLQLLQQGTQTDQVAHIFRKDARLLLDEDASFKDKQYVKFQRMLMMAAVPVTAHWFLWICCAAFLAIMVLLVPFALTLKVQLSFGVIFLFLCLASAAAIGLPVLAINHLAEQRRKKMEGQFPTALDIFTRALRAGHPIGGAINLVTEEMEDPIGSEFGLVSDEVAYGADLTDSLQAMAERWDMEDIRMFVISLSVQNETGGNLAEILANLSGVIRERETMYMKVRALSSEGRMSAWMLTALPLFTMIAVFLMNPAFYLGIATDPIFVYGFPSLIGLYLVGILMIRKMIDLKV